MRRGTKGVAVVGPDIGGRVADAVTGSGAAVVAPEQADGLVWTGGDPQELRELVARLPLRWVQLPSAGIEDHASAIREHPHVAWTSAKGIYGPSVAEHALAMLLALRRGLLVHAAARVWTRGAPSTPLVGSDDVITVLGAGGIAVQFAHLLAPFNVRVRIVRRRVEGVFPAPHDGVFSQDDLSVALSGAAALVVTLPLTGSTRGLVGERELRRLAPRAVVVNVGRGAVVDQAALLALLEEDVLSGVGLDVTEPEPLPADHGLWSHPRCLITSHTANPEGWRVDQLCRLVQDNTSRFVNGQQLLGAVDAERGY